MAYLSQIMGDTRSVVQEFLRRRTLRRIKDEKSSKPPPRRQTAVRFEEDEGRSLAHKELQALELAGIDEDSLMKAMTPIDGVKAQGRGMLAAKTKGDYTRSTSRQQIDTRREGGHGVGVPQSHVKKQQNSTKNVYNVPLSAYFTSRLAAVKPYAKKQQHASDFNRHKKVSYSTVGTVAEQATCRDPIDMPFHNRANSSQYDDDSYYFLQARPSGSQHARTRQSSLHMTSSLSQTPRYQGHQPPLKPLRQQRPIRIEEPTSYFQNQSLASRQPNTLGTPGRTVADQGSVRPPSQNTVFTVSSSSPVDHESEGARRIQLSSPFLDMTSSSSSSISVVEVRSSQGWKPFRRLPQAHGKSGLSSLASFPLVPPPSRNTADACYTHQAASQTNQEMLMHSRTRPLMDTSPASSVGTLNTSSSNIPDLVSSGESSLSLHRHISSTSHSAHSNSSHSNRGDDAFDKPPQKSRSLGTNPLKFIVHNHKSLPFPSDAEYSQPTRSRLLDTPQEQISLKISHDCLSVEAIEKVTNEGRHIGNEVSKVLSFNEKSSPSSSHAEGILPIASHSMDPQQKNVSLHLSQDLLSVEAIEKVTNENGHIGNTNLPSTLLRFNVVEKSSPSSSQAEGILPKASHSVDPQQKNVSLQLSCDLLSVDAIEQMTNEGGLIGNSNLSSAVLNSNLMETSSPASSHAEGILLKGSQSMDAQPEKVSLQLSHDLLSVEAIDKRPNESGPFGNSNLSLQRHETSATPFNSQLRLPTAFNVMETQRNLDSFGHSKLGLLQQGSSSFSSSQISHPGCDVPKTLSSPLEQNDNFSLRERYKSLAQPLPQVQPKPSNSPSAEIAFQTESVGNSRLSLQKHKSSPHSSKSMVSELWHLAYVNNAHPQRAASDVSAAFGGLDSTIPSSNTTMPRPKRSSSGASIESQSSLYIGKDLAVQKISNLEGSQFADYAGQSGPEVKDPGEDSLETLVNSIKESGRRMTQRNIPRSDPPALTQFVVAALDPDDHIRDRCRKKPEGNKSSRMTQGASDPALDDKHPSRGRSIPGSPENNLPPNSDKGESSIFRNPSRNTFGSRDSGDMSFVGGKSDENRNPEGVARGRQIIQGMTDDLRRFLTPSYEATDAAIAPVDTNTKASRRRSFIHTSATSSLLAAEDIQAHRREDAVGSTDGDTSLSPVPMDRKSGQRQRDACRQNHHDTKPFSPFDGRNNQQLFRVHSDGDEMASHKEFLLQASPHERTYTTLDVVCSKPTDANCQQRKQHGVESSGSSLSSASALFARKERKKYNRSQGNPAFKSYVSVRHHGPRSDGSCSSWATTEQGFLAGSALEVNYVRAVHRHSARPRSGIINDHLPDHSTIYISSSESSTSTAVEDIIARCQQKLENQTHKRPAN
jgi:hypothetical protein